MTSSNIEASVPGALERAHNAAVLGSGSARSGVFSTEQKYALRLLNAAREAANSWASWEAINDAMADGEETRRSAEYLQLDALSYLRRALARDAILGAFRLTDPYVKNEDRITLLKVVADLDSDREILMTSRDWFKQFGTTEDVIIDMEMDANRHRIHGLRQRLPDLVWKNSARNESDTSFRDLRQKLKPVRDSLAHLLEGRQSPNPNGIVLNDIRDLIRQTLDMATDVAILWNGSAPSADESMRLASRRAQKFWTYAFEGAVTTWKKDIDQAQALGIDKK